MTSARLASRRSRAGRPGAVPTAGAAAAASVIVAGLAGLAPGAALAALAALLLAGAIGLAVVELRMPVPITLMALWTGAMVIGGRTVAQLGPGPLYPTELVFGFAALALVWRWLQSGRIDRHPLLASRAASLGFAVFAAAVVIALARGLSGYGHAALRDAGLGYPLLAIIVIWWVGDDRRLQDGWLRVWFVASLIVSLTVVAAAVGALPSSFGPQGFEVGFALLLALAPMLDSWMHGDLGIWGRLWVVAVPLAATGVLVSRSGLWSIAVGALVLAALNLRVRRARLAMVAIAVVGVAGLIGVYNVDSPLITGNRVVQEFTDTVTLASNLKGNNTTFRIDAASQLLSRSVKGPGPVLFGAGFGRPSDFVVFGEVWDTRTGGGGVGDATVSGPHDGVVDIIYRLGWPAGLAFAGLIIGLCAFTLQCLRIAEPRDARVLRTLLAIVIAGCFTLLTSDGLRSPQFSVVFVCACALLAARAFTVSADPSPAGSATSSGAR